MVERSSLSHHCEDLNRFETISFRKINEEASDFFKFSNEKVVLTNKIVRTIKPKKFYSILDIGCGEGYVIRRILKDVRHCTALDPDESMLETLKKHVGDYSNISFVNKKFEDFETAEKFDVVISSHTLSFFSKKQQIIDKMLGLTKMNGRLILVLHCYESGQLQQLMEMFRMIRNREVNHIYAETLESYFLQRGLTPKFEKVETIAEFPSIETMLKLSYFFWRIDYENAEEQIKNLIRNYLVQKKTNQHSEIRALHGIITITISSNAHSSHQKYV